MKALPSRWPLALGALAVALLALGGNIPRGGRTPNIPQTENDFVFLDGNSINSTINSDGMYVDSRLANRAGLEWPKGSGKTAVYGAGLWVTGIHRSSHTIRTAVMDYISEYQPGPLLEEFNSQTNNDVLPVNRAADNRYRSYKIGKGSVRSEDYLEWPGDLGAPFVDVNKNGQWDPGIDVPRLVGDQQVWMVINDVNNSFHRGLGTTPPMGLEIRCLYYAFDQPGALGNTMFLKWDIINRSDADYDSVYLSLWSDVDLGDGNDDFPGCDSLLDLGYVYNGHDSDQYSFGYGNRPPADGFAFLEGPTIPGTPQDSALVEGKWVKGRRNLPMTAFGIFAHGTYPQLSDPPMGISKYPSVAYDFMKGKAGATHEWINSAVTGLPMTKWFSGDPVAATGDLPANFILRQFSPQDVEILPSAGPFSLARGDTQHFLGAFVIAQGTDRLNSVTLLKEITAEVRSTYRTARPAPTVLIPRSLSFARQDIVGLPDTGVCTIVNATEDTVSVTGISLGPGAFTLIGAPSVPCRIVPDGVLNLHASFSPPARGAYQDSFLIQTNSSRVPSARVILSGRGFHIGTAAVGRLYASSSDSGFIAVNTVSGLATQIGTIQGNPPSLAIRVSMRELYGFRWPDLCRIDPEAGDTMRVQSFHVPGLSCIAFSPADGLFGGTSSGKLYRLYLESGDTMCIGVSSTSPFAGLTFSPGGRLWATFRPASGIRMDSVYTIDTSTAAATYVGMTGDSAFTPAIAFGPDGVLYGVKGIYSQVNRLIRIDPSTGAGSAVGSMGVTRTTTLAMRVDSLSNGVGERVVDGIPVEFGLEQNFPNPFNPTTQFGVRIARTEIVSIKIFDLLGREVTTLLNELRTPGKYTVTWDARGKASGMYICQIRAGKFTAARKVLLIR